MRQLADDPSTEPAPPSTARAANRRADSPRPLIPDRDNDNPEFHRIKRLPPYVFEEVNA